MATESRERAAEGAERFAILGVGKHLLALSTHQVSEMFVLPDTRRPPHTPPHHRGVVSLRGRVLPALDLRVCLGLVSARSEVDAFVTLLTEREQDHRAWLAELEASVREGRPFGLATDPHLCKFGRWYDGYRAENVVLQNELARFEQPHADIHALGLEVGRLAAEGNAAEALRRVEAAREGLLAELCRQFERTREVVREQHKEIGVVVRLPGAEAVLVVDRAEAVAPLQPFEDDADPIAAGVLRAELVAGVARWKEASEPVLRLDLARLASFRP